MLKKATSLLFPLLILILALIASPEEVVAGSKILTNITDGFRNAASTWQKILLHYADRLFWILATINIVWVAGISFVKGELREVGAFFGILVRFTVTVGFFYWLLLNGPEMAGSIIASMTKAAAEIMGSHKTDASNFIDFALALYQKFTAEISISGFKTLGIFLVSSLTALFILVILCLITANLAIEYCAAWILTYAGCFILGFGGSYWTSDMAISYFRAVLASAIRLMAMILMIGVASSIISEHIGSIKRAPELQDLAEVVVVSLILLSLMNKVPNMLAGLVGGGQGAGNLGIGAVMGAAGLAMGAMSLAGSAAALGGSVAGSYLGMASRAAGAVDLGGGSAVKNAVMSAQNAMSSFDAPSMMGGQFGGSGGGAPQSQGPVASSFGNTGIFSAGTPFATPISGGNGGPFGSTAGGGSGGASGAAAPSMAGGAKSNFDVREASTGTGSISSPGHPSSSYSNAASPVSEGGVSSPSANAAAEYSHAKDTSAFASTPSESAPLNSPSTGSSLAESMKDAQDAATQVDTAKDPASNNQRQGKAASDYLAQGLRDLANDLEK